MVYFQSEILCGISMNSSIIQYLFDENRINIKGAAAAARQPPSQTNLSLNIWSIFNPKTPMESIYYNPVLFDENRTNIRGAAAF